MSRLAAVARWLEEHRTQAGTLALAVCLAGGALALAGAANA